jgi:hypothetical protein
MAAPSRRFRGRSAGKTAERFGERLDGLNAPQPILFESAMDDVCELSWDEITDFAQLADGLVGNIVDEGVLRASPVRPLPGKELV